MAKTKIYKSTVINVAKFGSPDRSQALTITMAKGSSGQYNVKSTLKEGRGKGSPKAITGTRLSVPSEQEAKDYFDRLVADAERKGWIKGASSSSRNAFTEIPAPSAVASTPTEPAKPGKKGK